jgi:cytosine/adenosine deaminase-related metal-dependent hydrolase
MILVEHATVVTVDRPRRIYRDGSVLVDGPDVVQVGRAGDVTPPRPPDRVIDGRRSVVLPGFVDTHVHLSEHLNRGLLLDDIPVDRYLPDWLVPLYSVMTSEEERVSAMLACAEMIRTGTTTFCEAGTLFDVAAVADAIDALGVLAPNAKLAHMVYVTDADVERLARRGVKVSHCPTAGLKHTKGLAAHGRFPEMLDRGVCVSLGGDSGNGSNHLDMLRLMYLTATIYKDARLDVGVIPPETALEMATIRGAEALLLEREIGSIEVGKRADLVIYDLDVPEWRPLLNPLNNLIYAATGASVRTVLIDGRVVLDDGRFTTIDERALFDRVETLARQQIARAGLRIESKWPVVT